MPKPVVLDIFCGAGGMSEGFLQAGFKVAFASDISKEAQQTYENRHKQLGYQVNFARVDIRKFSSKEYLEDFIEDVKIDVVCGGPPCQGFSLAGKREKNDPRNTLFAHYIKTIYNVKPDYFVMENVKGILSMRLEKFEGLFKDIYINRTVPYILKNEFENIGYDVKKDVLQANDYGVPQNRERVFFIGCRKDSSIVPADFPKRLIERDVAVQEAIDDLSFLGSGEIADKYENEFELTDYQHASILGRTPDINGVPIRSQKLHNHQASRHTIKVRERFALLNEGEDLKSLKERLDAEVWEKYKTKKTRCYKLKRNEVSPTIVTLPDDLIHYSKNRIMTVRELARIQSFDDSFEFKGVRTTGGELRKMTVPQYTQVGNAVPPLMAKAIAEEIMIAIKKTRGEEI